jgi:thiol-disulfide isomerase/thioredoxin
MLFICLTAGEKPIYSPFTLAIPFCMIPGKNILFFLLATTIFEVNAQKVQQIKLVQLEQIIYAQKAPVVVVNFWATWCKPCVEELPHFEKIAKENPAVKVLLVNLDPLTNTTAKVRPFLKSRRITAQVYILDEGKPAQWISRIHSDWSGAIPATLFIANKQKQLIEQELTKEQLEDKIRSLLP